MCVREVACSSRWEDVISAIVNPFGIRSKLVDDDVRGGMNLAEVDGERAK